jgi:hypothetical protein
MAANFWTHKKDDVDLKALPLRCFVKIPEARHICTFLTVGFVCVHNDQRRTHSHFFLLAFLFVKPRVILHPEILCSDHTVRIGTGKESVCVEGETGWPGSRGVRLLLWNSCCTALG